MSGAGVGSAVQPAIGRGSCGARRDVPGDCRSPATRRGGRWPGASQPAVHDEQRSLSGLLEGPDHWEKRTEEGLKTGLRYFQQAIDADPGYARAFAGLADSYNLLARYAFLAPSEALSRAKAAASRALDLDETLAEPHASLGYAAANYDWDWLKAEREFTQAIALNPDYATARHWYALNLAAMGRLDQALAEGKRAQQLDPLSLIVNSNVGRFLYYARRYDEAIEQFRKTLDLDANFGEAHLRLGKVYVQQDKFTEAIAEIQKARVLGASGATGALGHAYARAGRSRDARTIIDELVARSKQRYVSPCEIAIVHLGLGDSDQAFAFLEQAYVEHYSLLVYLGVDPEVDSLRTDSRFRSLLQRIGIPAAVDAVSENGRAEPKKAGRHP